MSQPRVLSVGQCGFDRGTIARHLGQQFNARVTASDTFDEALAELRAGSYDLVLVNRLTDADGSQGLELIRALKGDPSLSSLPVMLVSNYARAQADAVALGALPGFGKSELRDPKTREMLEAALATGGRSSPGAPAGS